MATLQDARNNTSTGEDARPEWLPQEFKSPQDLAKSYSELRKRMSRGERQHPRPGVSGEQDKPASVLPHDTAETSKGEPSAVDQDQQPRDHDKLVIEAAASQQEPEKVLSSKGLDFAEFDADFRAHGALSEASYEKLVNSGVPRSFVEAYIAGQTAIAEKSLQSIYAVAGGSREAFQEVIQWAKDNASPDEIAVYNRLADAGDVEGVKAIARGFQARYSQEYPQEPTLIGGEPSRSGGMIYATSAEVLAAVKDPRYKTDAAYRQAHEQKLMRSDVFRGGRGRVRAATTPLLRLERPRSPAASLACLPTLAGT